MSKNLTLTLNAQDIKHAVKSDSYITGQIDKSADMVKNAALAFNEQAGNEQHHEMKLYRTMKGALAKFESQLTEYIETSESSASITDDLTFASTTFNIVLTVGDRTSGAFATTLAYLAQEYIINTMLYYWWQPIKPALAKDYIAFAADNILDVKRCLAKSAPATSDTAYSDISGSVTPITGTLSIIDHNFVFPLYQPNIAQAGLYITFSRETTAEELIENLRFNYFVSGSAGETVQALNKPYGTEGLYVAAGDGSGDEMFYLTHRAGNTWEIISVSEYGPYWASMGLMEA